MSVQHPYNIYLDNSQEKNNTVLLYDSINVQRRPQAKQEILLNTFNTIHCPGSNKCYSIEKPTAFLDLENNIIIQMFNASDRYKYKQLSQDFAELIKQIPSNLFQDKEDEYNLQQTLFTDIKDYKISHPHHSHKEFYRIVFGREEFQEKLLTRELELCDKLIELLKVFIIHSHPILLRHDRLRIYLKELKNNYLYFLVKYDHNDTLYTVKVSYQLYISLTQNTNLINNICTENFIEEDVLGELTELPDYWVNFWRWQPQITALQNLYYTNKNTNIQEQINSIEDILEYLPSGQQLPSWAKKILLKISSNTQINNTLKEKILNKLYKQDCNNSLDFWFYNNDPENINTIWNIINNIQQIEDHLNLETSIIKSIKLKKEKPQYITEFINPAPAANYYNSQTQNSLTLINNLARNILNGGNLNTSITNLSNALANTPRGVNLPVNTRESLRTIFDYINLNYNNNFQQYTIRDNIFEVRFNIRPNPAWAEKGINSLTSAWNILEKLPDFILGNPQQLDQLINKNLGSASGAWYTGQDIIEISSTLPSDYFAGTLRHEIAHGVQDYLDTYKYNTVDNWLKSAFGWQTFGSITNSYIISNAEIDSLMNTLGGWQGLNDYYKPGVYQDIRQALSAGARGQRYILRNTPQNLPIHNIYNKTDLQNAYLNYKNWHFYNNHGYFFNFYYGQICKVNINSIRLVHYYFPSAYALFSDKEFFAELYSFYYDTNNPKRQKLMQTSAGRFIANWFKNNIEQQRVNA